MGSKSYYASYAQTALAVGPEPTPYPEAPTEGEVADEVVGQLPEYTTIDLAIIVAVVVAIIIGIYSIYDHRRLRK